MLAALNDVLLNLADPVLGFLLALPRDAALVAVSLGTAAILTVVRVFTTNQDLLRRCRNDKKRLGRRLKEIRRRDDSATIHTHLSVIRRGVARHGHSLGSGDLHRLHKLLAKSVKRGDVERLRAARNSVALRTLRQEGLPLLVSLPFIAMVAVWAFTRLAYYPPDEDATVVVRMHLPASAEGRLVHLVPREGLTTESGWIQTVGLSMADGKPYGVAQWELEGAASGTPYPLVVKDGQRVYTHQLRIGGKRYATPVKIFDDRGEYAIETKLRLYRPFGVIRRIPKIPLDPWILGYLAIVIPFVPLLKRLARVY